MTVLNADLLVANDNGRLASLSTSEGKMVCRVETLCLSSLKGVREAGQELIDRTGTKSIANQLDDFLGEATSDVGFCIRSGDDVHVFDLFLEWLNDVCCERFSISEKRLDYIFTGRAHSEAVGGLVVGAERQALPHGGGFGVTDLPPIPLAFALSAICSTQSVKPPMNSR